MSSKKTAIGIVEAYSCGCGGPHLLKENSFQGELAKKNDSEQPKERDGNVHHSLVKLNTPPPS